MTEKEKTVIQFQWELTETCLDFVKKHFKSGDFCGSQIYRHPKTNTKWVLKWCPYGDDSSNNKNDSLIYLWMLNSPINLVQCSIQHIISCNQSNETIEHIEMFYTAPCSAGYSQNIGNINEINAQSLTFQCVIAVADIIFNGIFFSHFRNCRSCKNKKLTKHKKIKRHRKKTMSH